MADRKVVFPEDMGKGLKWNAQNKKWEVAVSNGKGNLLEVRKDGLYLGEQAPDDIAQQFVDAVAGNDSNDGTRANPLRTIREAFKRKPKGQMTRVFLMENQTHEWRSSWLNDCDGKPFAIQPYGPITDGLKRINPVGTVQWMRSQECPRPTINFIADRALTTTTTTTTTTAAAAVVRQASSMSGNVRNEIAGCILRIKPEEVNRDGIVQIEKGVFGHRDYSLDLNYVGCIFDEFNDGIYLHQVGATTNLFFDSCFVKIKGPGPLTPPYLPGDRCGPENAVNLISMSKKGQLKIGFDQTAQSNQGKQIPGVQNGGTLRYMDKFTYNYDCQYWWENRTGAVLSNNVFGQTS